MRAVNFKWRVVDPVLRKLRLEPEEDEIPLTVYRALVEHINERVAAAWELFVWPELQVTEERAFRPRWISTFTYAVGAEVYYLPSKTYHVATVATVAGETPGISNKWTEIVALDRYVALDQRGSTPIGSVVSVHGSDPRALTYSSCGNDIDFGLSESGVDLPLSTGATVWMTYQITPSRFTLRPRVDSKDYAIGDRAYAPQTGETYRCVTPHTDISTTNESYWRLEPLPAFMAPSVIEGAYADCLREWDQGLSGDLIQTRRQLANDADARASELITQEITKLQAQGYGRFTYRMGGHARRSIFRYCAPLGVPV